MTSAINNLTLLAPEQETRRALAILPEQPKLKFVIEANSLDLRKIKNLFIAISVTALPQVADITKQANDIKLLRVLFIRENIQGEWLPQMLARADLRMARNILAHAADDWRTPCRVIRAWQTGSQHDLIARASVADDYLLVMNCALESFQVNFSDLAALKRIPAKERAQFDISDSGSYIHWGTTDVHLDIDAIRYATDENWRKKCDLNKIVHNKNLGRAIAAVRRQHKLDKTDIPGISDRQLRRIENEGARPGSETLTVLAKAHKMNVNIYLNEIANHM